MSAEPYVSMYGGLGTCKWCGQDAELRLGVCFDCAERQEQQITGKNEQRIADLEAQLAASEAAAAVMREALELVIDWADIGMNKKYRPMTLGGVRMMLKLAAEKALATDHGKAAAERMAKLERVAEWSREYLEAKSEMAGAIAGVNLLDALKALEDKS